VVAARSAGAALDLLFTMPCRKPSCSWSLGGRRGARAEAVRLAWETGAVLALALLREHPAALGKISIEDHPALAGGFSCRRHHDTAVQTACPENATA
jgi:hypothetical protein